MNQWQTAEFFCSVNVGTICAVDNDGLIFIARIDLKAIEKEACASRTLFHHIFCFYISLMAKRGPPLFRLIKIFLHNVMR